MSRFDRAALLFSILAILVSYWISERYYERLAHLEDEMAYVWQAQAAARGELSVSSPPDGKGSFLYPFVIDYQGLRFGKYPPGWPALLGIGESLGMRSWVNPMLAGLGVWLIYCLGKRTLGEVVGLLAAGLTLTSPFFLVNSASLLSHPWGLALSAGFALSWLGAFGDQPAASPLGLPGASSARFTRLLHSPWLPTLAAALAMGVLVLTRPFTALAIAIPFGLHGVYRLVRGGGNVRLRLLAFGGIVLAISSLYFAWQYAVTGDPLLNPYTLWWEYDKIGFGPGYGHREQGHTLRQAWINTRFSLRAANFDLFGWPKITWIPLLFGLWAVLRYREKRLEALLLSSVFPVLVILYLAYWVGASLYGPRYYYEGLYSVTLLAGAGFAWLAGWPVRPSQAYRGAGADSAAGRFSFRRLRPLLVTGLLALLVGFNLVFYLPARLNMMYGLYGVQRSHQEFFLSAAAQQLTPALVVVHPQKEWIEYGTLLGLENPFLDTPFIFIYSRGGSIDARIAANFPERTVYHYYPDEPNKLYSTPRPRRD